MPVVCHLSLRRRLSVIEHSDIFDTLQGSIVIFGVLRTHAFVSPFLDREESAFCWIEFFIGWEVSATKMHKNKDLDKLVSGQYSYFKMNDFTFDY
jgi:hypothetical protein